MCMSVLCCAHPYLENIYTTFKLREEAPHVRSNRQSNAAEGPQIVSALASIFLSILV